MFSLNVLFTLNTIVGLLFSLGFIIIPEQFMSLYGAPISPATVYVARLFGALILGFINILWFARNSSDSEARRAIVTGGSVGWFVGLIWVLAGQISGVVNNLGWINVIIYSFFTLGYGYFQYVKKD
ncbi:hypothetical protein ACFLUA_02855 [Chloroflexota bacterium]